MYDVTHWTKEQVADWVYNIGTTGKLRVIKCRNLIASYMCNGILLYVILLIVDSIGELAQYAELFVENDINGKRYGIA